MPDEPFTPTTGQFITDKMVRDWLRKPFRPEQIGKLPATAKRPALDFVGHAAVTDRLNRIAPDWTYTIDQMSTIGETIWIRGTMTIGGVSRPEFGDGADPKEAIGNFLRRGAMRFGVAIDLWSREELQPKASGGALGEGEAPGTPPETVAAHAAGDERAGAAPHSAPARTYPLTESDCDHKGPSGRWLPRKQIDGAPRCPRCGALAAKYMEAA
jgi:hypothetical protein